MVNLTTEGKGREGKGKGQHCLSCRPDQRGREWGDAQRFNPRDAPAQDRNHLLRFHKLSNSATQLWARCSSTCAFGEHFKCKPQLSIATAGHSCDKRHKGFRVPTDMQARRALCCSTQGLLRASKWANILSIHICGSSVTSIVSAGLF